MTRWCGAAAGGSQHTARAGGNKGRKAGQGPDWAEGGGGVVNGALLWGQGRRQSQVEGYEIDKGAAGTSAHFTGDNVVLRGWPCTFRGRAV